MNNLIGFYTTFNYRYIGSDRRTGLWKASVKGFETYKSVQRAMLGVKLGEAGPRNLVELENDSKLIYETLFCCSLGYFVIYIWVTLNICINTQN